MKNTILVLFSVILGLPAFGQEKGKALDLYFAANKLYNDGLYKQSIFAYEEFLRKHPKHPKAINGQYGMGLSHYQLKQYDKAAAVLGKIAGNPKAPDVPRANLFWGQSLLMLGKPADAEGAFAAGINALPKDPKDLALVAGLKASQLDALYQQKKWKDVVSVTKSLKGKAGTHSTRVSFMGASALYELKQFKEAGTALADLKPSVKNTPYEQQTHFLLAESLREQKQYPLAIKEFEVAAGLKGDDAPEALYRLGHVTFYKLHDYKAAAEYSLGFVKKYHASEAPSRVLKCQLRYARSLVELDEFQTAERYYSVLCKQKNVDSDVYLWRSRLYTRQKRIPEAIAAIKSGQIINPKSYPLEYEHIFLKAVSDASPKIKKLLIGARAIEDLGDYPACIKLLRDGLKEDPRSPISPYISWQIAMCIFQEFDETDPLSTKGNFTEAERELSMTIALYPENEWMPFMLFDLANQQMKLGNALKGDAAKKAYLIKSIKIFERLLKDHSNIFLMEDAVRLSAFNLHSANNFKQSFELCVQFLEKYGMSEQAAEVQFLKSENLFFQKQYNEAIKAYGSYITTYRQTDRVNTTKMRIGHSEYELKNWKAAVAVLRPLAEARVTGSVFDQLEFKVGECYYKQTNWAKAIEFYLKFVELKPKSTNADTALIKAGLASEELKKNADAIAAYQKLEKVRPNSMHLPHAQLRLGILYYDGKKYAESRAALQKVKALKEHKLRPNAVYYLAWVTWSESKLIEADKLFAKVISDFPEHELAPDSLFRLGEVKIQRKNYKGAVECFTRYINKYKNSVTKDELEAARKSVKRAQDILVGKIAPPEVAIIPDRPPARTEGFIKGYGTGFFITTDGFILTNHHVVDDAIAVSIKIGGREIPAKIIKVDKENDLAVLKVKGEFNALPLKSSDNVNLGEEVFTLGFPRPGIQGTSIKLTSGRISSLAGWRDEPGNFQISVPIQPGNSGGPLVDENGNVVGVVVSQLNAVSLFKEKGSLPQNVNYAVKGSLALKLLKSLPDVQERNMREPSAKGGKRFTDVVKHTQKSTCMIILR